MSNLKCAVIVLWCAFLGTVQFLWKEANSELSPKQKRMAMAILIVITDLAYCIASHQFDLARLIHEVAVSLIANWLSS